MTIPKYVPRLVQSGKSTAATYHFRCEPRGFGWAMGTINDETGELQIMSDWGNWSHRWSADPYHLGEPTLTHFIGSKASHRCHYLADKLAREGGHAFDAEATVNKMRGTLVVERRRERLPAGLARDIWDGLGSLVECGRSSDLFIERFFCIDGASDWVTQEPWEELVFSPTTGYMVLLHGILPALVDACAAEVRRRNAIVVSIAPVPEAPPCP